MSDATEATWLQPPAFGDADREKGGIPRRHRASWLYRSFRKTRYFLMFAVLLLLYLPGSRRSAAKPAWLEQGTLRAMQAKVGLHPCNRWDPFGPEAKDPPTCKNAKLFRQVEKLLQDTRLLTSINHFLVEQNTAALKEVRKCALGERKCPERPVIMGVYWYFTEGVSKSSTSGEVIWMGSAIEMMEEAGYQPIAVLNYEGMINLYRAIPDLIHMVWADNMFVVSCATDPKCIRPQDYTQPANTSHAFDVETIPEGERGVIPLWRLFVTDFWGARPPSLSGSAYYWGIKQEQEWSFNPLGQAWSLAPYRYPGHTYLPYSIEKVCTQLPFKPHEERNATALILAKKSSYFYADGAPPVTFWSSKEAQELPVSLISTADVDPPENRPLPAGIASLGHQSREQYEAVVNSARAMLGIGFPKASPSVYTALCQGTPVILPYFRDEAVPSGWKLFSDMYVQHGPAAALGPPYVYSYYRQDEVDLADQIRAAAATPIGRYIPEDMQWQNAVSRLRGILQADWEGRYLTVIQENNGTVPGVMDPVRARCFEMKRCMTLDESRA